MNDASRDADEGSGPDHIYAHVKPEMRDVLHIGDESRVDACWERIWIPTTSTRDAFSLLQRCLNAGATTKPEGGVITGISDTGKSFTMKRFRDLHAPKPAPDEEYAEFPAIYFMAPDKLNKSGFYKIICRETGFPLSYNAGETDLRNYAMSRIKDCQVRVVMLDELHDIGREHGSQTVEYLRFIKGIVNECERPFVVGGEPVILDLLLKEKQMESRFDNVVTMDRLPDAEFVKFILAYEKMLPLRRPSDFRANPGVIAALLGHTGGYVGRLSRVLKSACRIAIERKEERITADILGRTTGRSLRDAVAARAGGSGGR